jgi:hypothetical protein
MVLAPARGKFPGSFFNDNRPCDIAAGIVRECFEEIGLQDHDLQAPCDFVILMDRRSITCSTDALCIDAPEENRPCMAKT